MKIEIKLPITTHFAGLPPRAVFKRASGRNNEDLFFKTDAEENCRNAVSLTTGTFWTFFPDSEVIEQPTARLVID